MERVEPVAGGVRVTVRDLGEIAMPARVVGITAAGDNVRAEVPVETWLAGARTATVTLPSGAPLARVEIDPEHLFSDARPENNRWASAPAPRP